MNEKFFSLPEVKQKAIINAGYRVFTRNSYKNSPMSEIAAAADISKSLLFHYFVNKKGLYMFLWEKCVETTQETMRRYNCYEERDLFACMRLGMKAKLEIMREYPDLGNFALKAFYEDDPAVREEIHNSYDKYFQASASNALQMMETSNLKPGLDVKMMYRDMYLASEGYVWEMLQRGNWNADQMEADFDKLIDFWKSVYGK